MMKPTIEELFKNLAIKVLDDDHGISDDAYGALLDLATEINVDLALQLNKTVDAQDGRFFVHSDWKRNLHWKITPTMVTRQ